jgi:hypothetical protein
MRTVLKPFAVLTLTSCLTTLQFASLAWAQEATTLKTVQPPTRQLPVKVELATPSLLFAPQRGFQAEIGYTRGQEEVQQKRVEGKADVTLDQTTTKVGYGFNDKFFLSTQVDYTSAKATADMAIPNLAPGSIQQTTKEGIGDPTLTAGGRMNFGEISAVASIGYLIPTGTAEVQVKQNLDTDYNGKKGGAEILPQLSVFRNNKSEIIYGGTAQYVVRQERKMNSKDFNGFATELKESGGNLAIVSAYIETPQTTHSLGLAMTYQKEASLHRDSRSSVDVAGTEIAAGTLYGNIHASKNISIIPAASYMYYVNDKINDTELSSQTKYSGTLNVRLLF